MKIAPCPICKGPMTAYTLAGYGLLRCGCGVTIQRKGVKVAELVEIWNAALTEKE